MFNLYNREIKLALGVIFLGLSVWQFSEGNIGNGIFTFLLAAIAILLLFFNENIILALFQMQKNDLGKAEKHLDRIVAPEKLVKRQQAYYHFLRGNMAAQTNLNVAEKHFKQAQKIGLKSNQDKAMVSLGLAGIAMSKRRKVEATKLLNEAKKLDEKNMLAEQIRMYKQHLKRI
jgi:tetratricopeptide (TPR) repeat protein